MSTPANINWAEGDPQQLAQQYLQLFGKSGVPVDLETGRSSLFAAAAYASAHNVLAATTDSNAAAKLRNIAATLEALAAAAAARDDESMLSHRPAQQQGTDPIKGFRAFADAYARRQQQGPSSGTSTAAADDDQDGGGDEDGTGLPLPAALVQRVMRCLDGRSAASAAAACKQLAAAYRLNTTLKLPESFKMYCQHLTAVAHGDDDEFFGDGSDQSLASVTWPLDGSAAAGIDVWLHMGRLALRCVVPMELSAAMLRPVPDPEKSSLLAIFVSSQPVPLYSSRAATADAAREARLGALCDSPPGQGSTARERMEALLTGGNRGPADAPAPAPPKDVFTAACCDVQVLGGMSQGWPLHLDGDLLTYGYRTGYKLRDPGFAAAVLSQDGDGSLQYADEDYKHGLFSSVRCVCSDAGNALVWCAADGGHRVKAFRAPKDLGGPRTADAGCNAGPDNGMSLQYTLCTSAKNWWGDDAGLHVLGTKVFAVKTTGMLLTWDIAGIPAQAKERHNSKAIGEYSEDELSAEDSDDEPIFIGDIDMRDLDDPTKLEVSRGVPPHAVYKLQRPSGFSGISRTCLLNSSSTTTRTLATACAPPGSWDNASIVVTHDMHTQQVKNLFMGHMYEVQDIAAAPEAWPGAEHLFATCARSGDVKLWDVRSRAGAAAVTLACGREPLEAVVLAANRGSSSGGGGSSGGGSAAGVAGSSAAVASGSSNQLGSGMLAFAGGAGQCVWAWDLRNGSAQSLYQLSTGNLVVEALAWHESSSSLIASCESSYENRFGECYRDDFIKVGQQDSSAAQFLSLFAPLMGIKDARSEFAGLPGFGDGASADGEQDDSDGEDTQYWPRAAKHKPGDFRAHLGLSEGCVLAYTFSDRASQAVPPSREPNFGGGW